jgi:hypothetical protein
MGHFADGGGQLTGESFDDGQADIPAGVAGPVERVVVIGAGIAGLTIANAMRFVDLVMLPQVDLYLWRLLPAAVGMLLLLFGLIWDSD